MRIRAVAFGTALAITGSLALAHDIPDARIDRAIQVVLHPGRLEIAYEVSLAELTLVRDYRELFGPGTGLDRLDLFDDYGRRVGPLEARGFLVQVDDAAVALRYERHDLAVEEHPRLTFHLTASIPPRGRLTLRDNNYASSEGSSRLAARADGVRLLDYDGPSNVEEVPIVPLWQLDDEAERRTRELQVSFEPGAAEQASPPPPNRPPERAAPTPSGPRGLPELIDGHDRRSVLALIAVAVVLGAAHAVQPGHGKTLVAAATLGQSRPGRGIALAGLVTIVHISSVLVLAVVLSLTRSARYASLNNGLTGTAGFVIAGIGAWRLGRHAAGLGEHPNTDNRDRPSADRSLLGLGLAGGIVPCWDAILLIVLAETMGRLGLGLILLAAFSLGMAAVLVVVGMTAGRLRGWLAASGRTRRWERGLGLLSGGLLLVIGAAMLFR